MTTAPITGPGAPAETPAQGTTMADSEATTAFRQRIARIDREAEEHAAARQHAKGKRTARERINDLLDDSTFLEIGRYTGSGAGDKARPSGVVTGLRSDRWPPGGRLLAGLLRLRRRPGHH